MRWLINPDNPTVLGKKKLIEKFAFIPTKCSGGYWVWLEKYLVVKKYVVRYVDWAVAEYKWETIEKRIM